MTATILHLKVSVPTVFTAAPSAKSPTVGKVTTFPASREAVIPKKGRNASI